jgi:hypothetical protein
MKKAILTLTFVIALLFVFQACNNSSPANEEPVKIENTLQSVSYFKDTANVDPLVLKEAFNSVNDAIAEIGYPDAGYKTWIIQPDSSEIRFMVQGHWPDQETYTKIHDAQLYKDAIAATESVFESLEWVEYHRFEKVK